MWVKETACMHTIHKSCLSVLYTSISISVTSTVFKPTGIKFALNALLHNEQFTENVE